MAILAASLNQTRLECLVAESGLESSEDILLVRQMDDIVRKAGFPRDQEQLLRLLSSLETLVIGLGRSIEEGTPIDQPFAIFVAVLYLHSYILTEEVSASSATLAAALLASLGSSLGRLASEELGKFCAHYAAHFGASKSPQPEPLSWALSLAYVIISPIVDEFGIESLTAISRTELSHKTADGLIGDFQAGLLALHGLSELDSSGSTCRPFLESQFGETSYAIAVRIFFTKARQLDVHRRGLCVRLGVQVV